MAPPFKQVQFEILYGQGISLLGELIDLGVAHDLVSKAGAWYSYGDIRIGQGKENSKNYFRENPEHAAELEQKLRDILLPKPEDVVESQETAEIDPFEG